MHKKKITVLVDGVETSQIVPLTAAEEDAIAAPRVPSAVTKLQFIRALRGAGALGPLRAAIATASVEAKEDWDAVAVLHRNDALLSFFGMTGAQLDAAFIDAATR